MPANIGRPATTCPGLGDEQAHAGPPGTEGLPAVPSRTLLAVVGTSTALSACNLYYAQPLLTTIAADLGLRASWAGSVVCASQVGYGCELLMLVPMANAFENRPRVLTSRQSVVSTRDIR